MECFSTLQSKCLCYKGAVRKSKALQIGKRLCAGNIPQRSFVRVFLSLIPEIEKHADNGLLPDLQGSRYLRMKISRVLTTQLPFPIVSHMRSNSASILSLS